MRTDYQNRQRTAYQNRQRTSGPPCRHPPAQLVVQANRAHGEPDRVRCQRCGAELLPTALPAPPRARRRPRA